MRRKERYVLTDVDNVHPVMPDIQVSLERITDERDFGQNADDEADG